MEPGHLHLVGRLALVAAAIACATFGLAPGRAAAVPLSIAVSGNRFVNGAGQTVRLLGVNHPSFEYACEYGYAYDDGDMDAADAAAIASWHATAVRIPLNEDCWLGVNNRPSNAQDPEPPLTATGYRQAVERYVSDLNADGLYAILDLHWSAPGTDTADGQRPMPDSHSVDFWSSVASAFKDNRAVVFDAFNEPFSPAAVNDSGYEVSWSCWRDGGCELPSSADGEPPDNDALYQAVGMQTLVNAIRASGATQPILLGGLDYANDLTGWLANEPSDPAGQLVASFHNYQGQSCESASCWDTTIASVAAHVPVVTGEFDEETCSPTGFDSAYMNWADAHGISYLAWGWSVLSQQEISGEGCSAYDLITDSTGTPAAPNGTALHDHLAALAAGEATTTTAGTTTTTTPPATSTGARATGGQSHPLVSLRSLSAHLAAGGSTVAFVLSSTQSCTGRLTVKTVKTFPTSAGKRRAHKISLGTVHFALSVTSAKTVVVKLSKELRELLVRRHSLEVQVAITLSGTQNPVLVTRRTLTLQAPARRKRKG